MMEGFGFQRIKVLDLTSYLSGPACTQILGFLGAKVIKIETPQGGDPARVSPPFAGPNGVHEEPQSAGDLAFGFLKRNRNKKSVALDLKAETGREVFLKLAANADVLVHNFRPGKIEKLGLDYETLAGINPALIYCALSGFGQEGEYRDIAAFDIVVQAMSGLMMLNGQPEDPPVKVNLLICDLVAGLYAAIGILAALARREETGRGQLLEVSMLDAILSFIMDEALDYWGERGLSPRTGNRLRRLTPFNAYQARDGWLVMAAGGSNALWRKICQVIGREDLEDDPRYLTQTGRSMGADEVDAAITAWTRELPVEKAVEELLNAGVPCAPVREIKEVLADESLRRQGTLTELPHPLLGLVPGYLTWNFPVKFSEEMVPALKAAPLLGQDTREVLKAAGIDGEELQALEAAGIIKVP